MGWDGVVKEMGATEKGKGTRERGKGRLSHGDEVLPLNRGETGVTHR